MRYQIYLEVNADEVLMEADPEAPYPEDEIVEDFPSMTCPGREISPVQQSRSYLGLKSSADTRASPSTTSPAAHSTLMVSAASFLLRG